MIDLATTALVACIRRLTRDLGRWVVVSSRPERLALFCTVDLDPTAV